MDPLASEWRMGGLEVPNRIVMAPMSTNRASSQGYVTPSLIRYLVRRAHGGCGMIILESATVDAIMGGTSRTLRLDDEECIPPARNLVRKLHSLGTVAVAQLWHAGPRASVNQGLPLSASLPEPGFPAARALEHEEIERIAQQFIEAADRVVQIGFDALEIHAAHGYLLHHFIDPITNRREDDYGVTTQGRYRLLAEIRAGIRSKHPGFPVLLRLSLRPDEDFSSIARCIESAAFDAVDVRTGFSSMPGNEGKRIPFGYTLGLARKLRPHLSIPVLAGGRILSPEQARRAVIEDRIDAVILGRALLADPDWGRRALKAQPVVPCLYDCNPSCYSKFKEGEVLHCVYHRRRE